MEHFILNKVNARKKQKKKKVNAIKKIKKDKYFNYIRLNQGIKKREKPTKHCTNSLLVH
jgi:hypothetical protein